MQTNLKDWCIENSREDLLEQWDYENNLTLIPEQCTPGMGKKVFWKCSLGHKWQTSIYARTGRSKTGCPICSNKKVLVGFNDLQSVHPNLAAEWHPTLNKDLKPTDIVAKSNKRTMRSLPPFWL